MSEKDEFMKTVQKMAGESVKECMDIVAVARRAGVQAFMDGKGKDANPVKAEGVDAETARLAWEAGWDAGKAEASFLARCGEAMKNSREVACELVQECRQPLGTTSILAASPEYTERVFEAALEIAYELGRKGVELTPEDFRAFANAKIKCRCSGS